MVAFLILHVIFMSACAGMLAAIAASVFELAYKTPQRIDRLPPPPPLPRLEVPPSSDDWMIVDDEFGRADTVPSASGDRPTVLD